MASINKSHIELIELIKMTEFNTKIVFLLATAFLCFALSTEESIQDFQFDHDDIQVFIFNKQFLP